MNTKITAYILAGGKSQRMGTDKGLLDLNGNTFAGHICQALKKITFAEIEIVIITPNKGYDALGYRRIEDMFADKGPVGGIYTALKDSKTKLNLILSVDVPLVSSDLLTWLLQEHQETFMITQAKVGEKASPLVAVYDRSCKTVFGEHLAAKQLKLRKIIDELTHNTLVVPEKWENQLQNINTPEEYKKIKE